MKTEEEVLTGLNGVEDEAPLIDIATRLATVSSLDETWVLLQELIEQHVRPTSWCFLLFESSTKKLRIRIAGGEGTNELIGQIWEEDLSPVDFAISARKNQVFRAPPKATPIASLSGNTSAQANDVVVVPLFMDGALLGALELVDVLSGDTFRQRITALKQIAAFGAVSIYNGRRMTQLQKLSIQDEHTGLYNARYLKRSLDLEVSRSERYDRPLSLLFIDLDNFKAVNDNHGHLIGSGLLRQVAEVIQSCIRKSDIAFRYGGDEFAVMLTETGQEPAEEVAARIRNELRGRKFMRDKGLSLRLTVSIGVASFPDHGSTTEDLIRASDQAMYRAKANGRDGVVTCDLTATTLRGP